jgi:arginyl-tRNA synthetase
MDFSSPNIAKPFSVGNIRSTIIGHAIYSLFKSQGYRMVGINHLGDWGTQFGKLIYAYQAWGDREKVEKDPIRELLALYVRFHEECRQGQPPPEGEEMAQLDESAPPANPLLEEEARKRFKLLEDGDEEAVALWKWFVQVSLQDFSRIYNRLGVSFDFVQGESFYMDKTGEVIELVKEKGLAERDADGSLLVRLDKYGIDTPLLLQKSDGATLYATRDMAGLIYRTRMFSPSMILYVVGSEQKLHFRQCFQLFHLLGFDARCHHIDFGIVSLKEGKMSTRAGRVIFFEDVLEEACQRVAGILEEKRPDLQMEEKEKIAQVVGIGAVKFNDLSQSRVKNVIFDWDKMLSFDGDTAPYLQYSYARVQSILRKADAEPKFLPGLIKEKAEIRLIGFLARFPGAVREAAGKFSPHLLAQYLLELARCFTEFYQAVPVLKAGSGELTASRLGLIRSYAAVMKKGLMLLGIDVLDRM